MTRTNRFQFMWVMLFAITGSLFITSCSDDEGEVAPIPSSEKNITSFNFAGLDPAINATVSGTNITATVPYDVDVTALVPTIVISDDATVSPASGVAQDFTNPVTYIVTAEDETTQTYTVTITAEDPPMIVLAAKWQRSSAEGGLPSWFSVNDDRDVSVFGDYVYVHNNNDKIRVLSALDGSDVAAGVEGDEDNPNRTFINGKENFASGNLFLLGTSTDSEGRIIASNLRVGSEALHPWNVYKWNDKDASQELLFAYPTPAGYRLGENLTVIGDVEGNATIFVPGGGFGVTNNKVLKFSITGGEVNLTPTVIEFAGITVMGNAPDVVPVSNNADANLIIAGTGVGGIAEYGQDGVLVARLDAALNDGETAPLFTFALDVATFEISGRKLIATTATDFTATPAVPTTGWVYVIDYTDGLENVTADHIKRFALTDASNIDTNGNGTGGVDVIVNGDEATVYAMITNFGVAAINVTIE